MFKERIYFMTHPSNLPALDDMLYTLLLFEEGEHEFSSEDEGVQELRQLFFPVTRQCVYLNHASTGPLPQPVAQTLRDYVDDACSFGGLHLDRWREYWKGAHRRIASLIHARPEQIALTASTGDGLRLIASELQWRAGDSVVVAEGEFPSNVYPWLSLQEQGVEVRTVPARNHRIATEDVLTSISERTRLVSLSLVEFATGYRNDIATIAAYCHERGILCGTDAIQALGALEVDVQQLGVDFLAAGAHKWLLAPQTCGFLYISDALLPQLQGRRKGWYSVEDPYNFFHYGQPLKAGAQRFEASFPNSFPIVGLDAALGVFECIDGGMQAIEQRVLGLTDYAIAGLERLGYPVITPQGQGERSGIVCFEPHPAHPHLGVPQITAELAARMIVVSPRGSVVRLAPHFYNTLEEIDAFLNALEEMQRTQEKAE
jgi:cysteine desulfurase/selenocysteine lyase